LTPKNPKKEEKMPNIEIHGYWIPLNGKLPTTLGLLIEQMEKVLGKLGLSTDAITDIVPSLARSCECHGTRKLMPYLRVCGTNQEERQKIAEALHKMIPDMDIEVLAIEKFIPGTP
jgi:hypothetical protein